MSTSLTSNLRPTFRSAPPPVQVPTRSTWAGFRAFYARRLKAPRWPVTRASPAITPPTATWRPTASSVRTISSVNTMPSPFLGLNAPTQHFSTHCARSEKLPLVAGYECTTRLPSPAKSRRRTRTPNSSRPTSRQIGQARKTSSQLTPAHPLTTQTDPPWAPTSCI